jgi:ribonuclease D
MRPPQLITTAAALNDLAATLNQQSTVAVDTESNSLHAFSEQVCLLQFSIPDADILVDPLALDDLQPLADVFANPAIEVIFHAAEYDVLTLKRDFDFIFANIFDTMLAARIAGRKHFGLGSLIEEEFGVTLQKKFQRADWGKRPLTNEMIDYARLDTHYLIELRARLYAQLAETERLPIAQEDFQRLAQVNGAPPGPPEVNIWRIKGVDDLNPNQAAILLRLAQYRHALAEKRDRPPFKVLGDNILLAVAAASPRNRAELSGVPGMNDRQTRQHQRGLLEAVEAGLRDEPQYRPRRPRPDDEYIQRYEALRKWRIKRALGMNVESDVILPRDILESIALESPATQAELDALLIDLPWRREQFSAELFQVVSAA